MPRTIELTEHGLPVHFQRPGTRRRRLSARTMSKLKPELLRVAGSGSRTAFKLVEAMYRIFPELKNE